MDGSLVHKLLVNREKKKGKKEFHFSICNGHNVGQQKMLFTCYKVTPEEQVYITKIYLSRNHKREAYVRIMIRQ